MKYENIEDDSYGSYISVIKFFKINSKLHEKKNDIITYIHNITMTMINFHRLQ
jgi:DNA-binding transcriptional regulator WhiA